MHKNIAYNKQGRTYPAVLIGRIAVAKEFQGKEYYIGYQIMNFIKKWFVTDDNKTGCLYVLVDAMNTEHTLSWNMVVIALNIRPLQNTRCINGVLISWIDRKILRIFKGH